MTRLLNTVAPLLLTAIFVIVRAQDFDFPILVSDGVNSLVLTIGVDPNGTIGYDPGLDLYAPPPPPAGAFDARLRIANEDYFKDIRGNSLTQKEFYMYYAPETGHSITISWDNTIVDSLGTFLMLDNIDGSYFSLNMATANSISISSYPILSNGLKILLTPNPVTGISPTTPNSLKPTTPKLYQNFPNPFNGVTRIKYYLPVTAPVNIGIYDNHGRLIKILKTGLESGGFHSVEWDGTNQSNADASSGVYFVIFKTAGHVLGKKLVLMK